MSTSIERVVVPLDGSKSSEAAVAPGVALATRLDGVLELLIARPEADRGIATQYLDGIDVALDGDRVRRRVETDKTAADAIVTQADNSAMLVCMATHGHTGVGDVVFGSTAEAVVRAAARPIVLVGPHSHHLDGLGGEPKVLVCVDGSEVSADALVLAELVSALGATVSLVVVSIVREIVGLGVVVDPTQVERLEQLTSEFRRRGIRADYEILSGHDVWAPIVEAAEALPAAFVAVVSHARDGVSRVLLGSEATTIVRHSPVPVLAVHANWGKR
jgi:nucleotide-binding universal stress UspA family protein